MNWLFTIFLLSFCVLQAKHKSIQIENSREYEVLTHFFKMGCLEEDYGYVLEGTKPISIRDFYPLDNFPVARDLNHSEKEFLNTLLVREMIPIWNKLYPLQEKFVLKSAPLNIPGEPEFGWEVSFINLPSLEKVIKQNIDLFRYILNPLTQAKELAERLAYSQETLSNILNNNCVLIGIVLGFGFGFGFGSHNSVVGGRSETVRASSHSRDMAPFAAKSHAMRDMKEYYGWNFFDIAGSDDFFEGFKRDVFPLKESFGFANAKEELLAIKTTNEPSPSCLIEKPMFIFEAYTGGLSNKPLFKDLKRVQGMRIGEKRKLFIHPCLAYGELTTLPPCKELIVKIHLLDFEVRSHEKSPSLKPLDFSWIQNPKLHSLVKKSIELILFLQKKNSKLSQIGAGIAGLTATYRLHPKGTHVQAYEAHN